MNNMINLESLEKFIVSLGDLQRIVLYIIHDCVCDVCKEEDIDNIESDILARKVKYYSFIYEPEKHITSVEVIL